MLDGSLLARKGDASPAISSNSPLLDELGEPRSETAVGTYGTGKPPEAGSAATPGLIGQLLAWFARHPIFGVIWLAIGIAILFGVTIAALTPWPHAAPPTPAASVAVPEKIMLPTDSDSIAGVSDREMEAADRASETLPAQSTQPEKMDRPDLSAATFPPEPPAPDVRPGPPAPPPAEVAATRPVPRPVPKPAAPAKPSVRSGPYLLQLSAVPNARGARRELARLEKRLGNVLGDRDIIIVKAVPPGKLPVYRLRVRAYESRSAARAACNRIRKLKLDCLAVKR
jgi:hypothetical protein